MPPKASRARGPFCGRRTTRQIIAVVGLVAAGAPACRNGGSGSGVERQPIAAATAAAPAAANAAQIVAAVQAHPRSPVGAGVAQSFKTVAGGLQPQFPAAAVGMERKPGSVVLPQAASGAM